MAITYVGGVVAGRTGNSNSTIDVSLSSGLTGGSNTGVSAGDLVVVTVCTGSAARASVVAVTAPATYQNLTAQRTTATTYDTNVQVSYKFMPSTPDSVVTIPAQGNIADGQAYAVQVFRGVDPNTPLDVTPTYATGSGTNNNPNPAAITPVTAGAWIVVTGGGASATGTTLYTASYLTNFLTQNGADTNDGTVGAGYYTGWTSGPYDPAAFGGGSANAANSWGATTIALRPAPEAQTLTPTLYSNGQTFYAPTITVGAVGLTPNLYENSNTFYAHTLTQPIPSQTLTASLYENTNSFYAATLTTSITLTAALYENSSTFYAPTITTGAVTLTAGLFTNSNTFYSATVNRGVVALTASLYSNTNAFYAPTISTVGGTQSLTTTRFDNSNTFFSISVSDGTLPVSTEEDVGVSRSRKPSRTRTVYVEVNKKTYPVREDQVVEFLNKFKQSEPKREAVKENVKTAYKIGNKQTKIVIKDAPMDFVMPAKTDYSNAIIELKFRQAMQRYQQDMEDEELLLLL